MRRRAAFSLALSPSFYLLSPISYLLPPVSCRLSSPIKRRHRERGGPSYARFVECSLPDWLPERSPSHS